MPVVRVKPSGAMTVGEGDGRDVRCGFCDRKASNVALLAWGVISVISMNRSVSEIELKHCRAVQRG